jgi:hypothetical protein
LRIQTLEDDIKTEDNKTLCPNQRNSRTHRLQIVFILPCYPLLCYRYQNIARRSDKGKENDKCWGMKLRPQYVTCCTGSGGGGFVIAWLAKGRCGYALCCNKQSAVTVWPGTEVEREICEDEVDNYREDQSAANWGRAETIGRVL